MEIVPVIDLKGGLVVHARGGRRDAYAPIRTPLSPTSAPGDVAAGLARLFAFRRLYVADLDAIEGAAPQHEAVAALGAGMPGAERWVDAGSAPTADTRVLGSESMVGAVPDEEGAVLSLDFRGADFLGPPEVLADATRWPERVIVMTLARVGAAAGPDLARLSAIVARAGDRQVYAAGGVRGMDDLRALAQAGAAGVLVATALHDGALGPAEIAAAARLGTGRR